MRGILFLSDRVRMTATAMAIDDITENVGGQSKSTGQSRRQAHLLAKDFPQSGQLNGSSSVCFLSCLFKYSSLEYLAPH